MNDMANLDKKIHRRAALAVVVWVCCLAGWATTTWAESVAMVTDVKGRTSMQGGAVQGEVTILAEIEPTVAAVSVMQIVLVSLLLALSAQFRRQAPSPIAR